VGARREFVHFGLGLHEVRPAVLEGPVSKRAATASAFAQSRTMKLSMGTISLNKFPHVCLTHGHSARMAILGRPCRMAELGLDLLHQFLRASALVVREACSEQGSCE
jgi:hypothetical protein